MKNTNQDNGFEYMLKFAEAWATVQHHGQMYGDEPYLCHLQDVYFWADDFVERDPSSFEPTHDGQVALIASWLHDTLEDCEDVNIPMLIHFFGDEVADVVDRVSTVRFCPETGRKGKNRKERHAWTYPRIRENKIAVFVKLCDRIANTSNCVAEQSDLLKMYKKEYPGFREALFVEGEYEELWDELDELYKCNLP